MSRQSRILRLIGLWGLPLMLVACVAGVAYYWSRPAPPPGRLKMTAGSPLGTRHELAEMFVEEAGAQGFRIEIEGCAGSEQALDAVNARKLDLAMVQGGLSSEGRPNVRQVATLQIEPLHLVVRKELYEEAAKHLGALDGKTVDLGEIGSGTHTLAKKVLEFAGLKEHRDDTPGGYVPLIQSREVIFAETDAGRLADAIFFVSALPARTVKYLVTRHGYRLVPLPFGEAFALESITKEVRKQRSQALPENIDNARTFDAVIPAFTYSVEPPVPPTPIPSLGNRLLVVAHKDVDPRTIQRLVELLYSSEFVTILRPPVDAKMLEQPPEFLWHPGTALYLKRHKPLVSGDVLESTRVTFTVLGALVPALLVFWRWLTLYRRAAREKAFRSILGAVTRIEQQAMLIERSAQLDLASLLSLQQQLGNLKAETMSRFTEGELTDKDVLADFLAQVDNARSYLTGLIAHEREMLASKAKAEGQSLNALWQEAAGR